jgi:hypothetical protein
MLLLDKIKPLKEDYELALSVYEIYTSYDPIMEAHKDPHVSFKPIVEEHNHLLHLTNGNK